MEDIVIVPCEKQGQRKRKEKDSRALKKEAQCHRAVARCSSRLNRSRDALPPALVAGARIGSGDAPAGSRRGELHASRQSSEIGIRGVTGPEREREERAGGKRRGRPMPSIGRPEGLSLLCSPASLFCCLEL